MKKTNKELIKEADKFTSKYIKKKNNFNKISIESSNDEFIHIYLDNKPIFCTDNFEEFKSRINALGYALLRRQC